MDMNSIKNKASKVADKAKKTITETDIDKLKDTASNTLKDTADKAKKSINEADFNKMKETATSKIKDADEKINNISQKKGISKPIILTGIASIILIVLFFLFSSDASKPSESDIQAGALNKMSGYGTSMYEVVDFDVTNEYTKTIKGEEVFIYEVEFTARNKKSKEMVSGTDYLQQDGNTIKYVFGLKKLGNRWALVR